MKQIDPGEQVEYNPIFMKRNPNGWLFVIDATKMNEQLVEVMDFVKELKTIEQKYQIKTNKYLIVNKTDLNQTQFSLEKLDEIKENDITQVKFMCTKLNLNVRETIREITLKIRQGMDKA